MATIEEQKLAMLQDVLTLVGQLRVEWDIYRRLVYRSPGLVEAADEYLSSPACAEKLATYKFLQNRTIHTFVQSTLNEFAESLGDLAGALNPLQTPSRKSMGGTEGQGNQA